MLGGQTLGEHGKCGVAAPTRQQHKRPHREQLNRKIGPQLARERIQEHRHDLGQRLPGGQRVRQVGGRRVNGPAPGVVGGGAQSEAGITE